MDLFSKTGESIEDNLIAGSSVPLLVKGVNLAAGQGVLLRGTVLGKHSSDGKHYKVNSATQAASADCILIADTDTGSGDVFTETYRSGHFNRRALIFGGADTADKHEIRLRELGIYLSDSIAY